MMNTMMQYPWTLVFMIGVQLATKNGGTLGVFEMKWRGQKFLLFIGILKLLAIGKK
jgi:hypothetical protein